MAKETNHRRKCKVARVAEELDFDKLAKELKRNNKFKPKYDSNKNKNNGKNYKKNDNKQKDFKNKNQNSNKNKKYPKKDK